MERQEILNKTHDTNKVYFGTKKKVMDLMSDGEWRSLMEIYLHTDVQPTTCSAILRTFRTEKYGSHFVNKKRDVKNGDWLYQLEINDPSHTE